MVICFCHFSDFQNKTLKIDEQTENVEENRQTKQRRRKKRKMVKETKVVSMEDETKKMKCV